MHVLLTRDQFREGYFENCNYLPTKLTEYPYVYVDDISDLRKKYGRHTTVRCDEVRVHYREECDCRGNEVFPTYSGNCDLWHCHPVAIKEKDAKNQAVFARKYGKVAYMRRYKFKKNARLQVAKYVKIMKIWGWDK